MLINEFNNVATLIPKSEFERVNLIVLHKVRNLQILKKKIKRQINHANYFKTQLWIIYATYENVADGGRGGRREGGSLLS